MLGKDKLDNTLFTCDQGYFNQITTRSRNLTLVTMVKDTFATSVPPEASQIIEDVPTSCTKHGLVVYFTTVPINFMNTVVM